MNKKMMTLGSTFALILATSASAQVISILPGGRGNLFVGTPANLPGPLAGVVITPMLTLSASALTPVLAQAPAPVPAQIPSPAIPVIPAMPSFPALPMSKIPEHMWNLSAHGSVALPYAALRANLSAPAKDAAAQQPANSRENLDNLFDGNKERSEKSSPVRSDRHQSLPEQDLESEIGAY